MEERISKFITISLWIAVISFVLRCLISLPTSIYGCFGHIGEAIAVTVIIVGIYERWLWKYNFTDKTPRLRKIYQGKLEYMNNGVPQEKIITIHVKQSLLATSIKIITDEIISNSISSKLVYENNEYILYYTYITNPKSKYSDENPIQYGTCRLRLDKESNFHGTYWTSRKRVGDIYFLSE